MAVYGEETTDHNIKERMVLCIAMSPCRRPAQLLEASEAGDSAQ